MSKLNPKLVTRLVAAAVMASAASMASAGATTGDLVVGATLTAGCEVQAGSIGFGNIIALASSGDKTADSGSTFKVACTSGVTPTIATSTTRSMTDGTGFLPFQLSLSAGAAADDFPSTTPGNLTLTQDGTLQTITIYAKVLSANFTGANALIAGTYTQTVVVDVAY